MNKSINITVLGAGAWGTAIAVALAKRHAVFLWARSENNVHSMVETRENKTYLPGVPLPMSLSVSNDLTQGLRHVQGSLHQEGLVMIATPVSGVRPLAHALQQVQQQQQQHDVLIPNAVLLCKGFEEKTGLLPHQIIQDVLGAALPCGVLTGPSFAQEVAKGLPCALTMATADTRLAQQVVAAVHGGTMRVYVSGDIIGVEVGGAVKNILAIATGVADGLGLGLNARAALITRGLAEMMRLGLALGGTEASFMGLSGVGDLLLTCTGDLSRNRRVGLALANGIPLADIVAELGHVAEGVRCAATVRSLAAQRLIDMPISEAVAAMLFEGVSARACVESLLLRDPREE